MKNAAGVVNRLVMISYSLQLKLFVFFFTYYKLLHFLFDSCFNKTDTFIFL